VFQLHEQFANPFPNSFAGQSNVWLHAYPFLIEVVPAEHIPLSSAYYDWHNK
jgi:hypothetical protein